MLTQKSILSVFLSVILLFACGGLVSSNAKDLPSFMCGPYSLCHVAEMYGMVAKPEVVAKLAGTTKDGTTMKGLADAAYQLRMKAVGQRTNYGNLLKLKTPLIALVKMQKSPTANHFIAIDKIDPNQLEIWDINQGYSIISRENFEAIWEGYVLTISPPCQQGLKVQGDVPDIEIDEPTYDFGTITEMEKVEHTFVIKNVGQKPLEILKVDSSCTCETVELRDKIIPPDKTTTLDIHYRGTTRSGKTRAAVYLTTNDPDEQQVVVSMVGVIVGVAGVYPKHFYLGEIGQEESVHKSFVIHRPRFGTLKVKSVTSSSSQIKTKLKRLNDKELIARVHFEIQPGLPIGPLREKITVYTNAVKYPEVQVLIEGTIVGDLRLEPKQFFMGFLQVGVPVRRTVTLEKRGKADFQILKIENNLSIVQIKTVPVEPGKRYQIEATCIPTASSEKLIRDVIQIHTNNSKQPLLKIPLYGILQSSSSQSHDKGDEK